MGLDGESYLASIDVKTVDASDGGPVSSMVVGVLLSGDVHRP